MSKHPIQPLELDLHNVLRFKENRVVSILYEKLRSMGIDPWSLLGRDNVTKDDLRQFAQLIGYSHSGAQDLPYMDDKTLEAAKIAYHSGKTELEARNEYLEERHRLMVEALTPLTLTAFVLHEDDLEPR